MHELLSAIGKELETVVHDKVYCRRKKLRSQERLVDVQRIAVTRKGMVKVD